MRIVRIGDKYTIANEEVKTFDLLPVQTYIVNFNPMEGFYLMVHPEMEVKEKIYGVHEEKVKKMFRSFQSFDRNLGIILSGRKGIGKTIFSKMICKEAMKQGYPVLIVDEAHKGLGRFIECIDQECVILFDEFDKTFSKHNMGGEQAKLLSLFDGTAQGKKMFLVTCNEINGLNQFIINRPGRFHYHLRFTYPKKEEIRQYLKDKLKPEYHKEITSVIAFADLISLNYDCLRAIAFELNQGILFKEAIEDLNILNLSSCNYDVCLYMEDGQVLQQKNWYGNLFDAEQTKKSVNFWSKDNTFLMEVCFDLKDLYYDEEKQVTLVAGNKLEICRENFCENRNFGGVNHNGMVNEEEEYLDLVDNEDYDEDYDENYDEDYDADYDEECVNEVESVEDFAEYEYENEDVEEEEVVGIDTPVTIRNLNPKEIKLENKPLYLVFTKSQEIKMHYKL